MCFCESDAVRILIHVKARKRFPGITFDEDALQKAAEHFHITNTDQIRRMPESEITRLSLILLRFLPLSACPYEYRQAM